MRETNLMIAIALARLFALLSGLTRVKAARREAIARNVKNIKQAERPFACDRRLSPEARKRHFDGSALNEIEVENARWIRISTPDTKTIVMVAE